MADRCTTATRCTPTSPAIGPSNASPDLAYDQREEDGGSLVFDGAVLAERL